MSEPAVERSVHYLKVGTLRKHDADGNENVDKERLNELNNAVHVQYKFWYISSPSSAKQQREMPKFKVLWRAWAHDNKFLFSVLTWRPFPPVLLLDNSAT